MRYLSIALTSLLLSNLALAQNVAPPVATPKPGQILVSGTVPDEASKQSALSK
ncbi:MAG TPA: cell envelope biogenesis protein OmpA, partial [Collimonas sp.]|nr:cell envelope biogenesis protein OmpA [Collimonas sp.]